MRILAAILFAIGLQQMAFAGAVPEIDPGSAGSALALLAGTVLVVRGRRR